jgi:hypothetical protein
MVDGVVMDERRQVDEFDDRRERLRLVRSFGPHLVAKEKQTGSEQLSADLEEVIVDLPDPIEIGDEYPAELVDHPVEPIGDWRLDPGEFRQVGKRCLMLSHSMNLRRV